MVVPFDIKQGASRAQLGADDVEVETARPVVVEINDCKAAAPVLEHDCMEDFWPCTRAWDGRWRGSICCSQGDAERENKGSACKHFKKICASLKLVGVMDHEIRSGLNSGQKSLRAAIAHSVALSMSGYLRKAVEAEGIEPIKKKFDREAALQRMKERHEREIETLMNMDTDGVQDLVVEREEEISDAMQSFEIRVAARRFYHEAPDDVFEVLVKLFSDVFENGDGLGGLNVLRLVSKRCFAMICLKAPTCPPSHVAQNSSGYSCPGQSLPTSLHYRHCHSWRRSISHTRPSKIFLLCLSSTILGS